MDDAVRVLVTKYVVICDTELGAERLEIGRGNRDQLLQGSLARFPERIRFPFELHEVRRKRVGQVPGGESGPKDIVQIV